ncbi:MAG TPA: STAS domain-containing protein [Pyrinomonadaceae bacterium]|nr:STAS domain-containing protein [Pyrinomonadaceae bacterium]
MLQVDVKTLNTVVILGLQGQVVTGDTDILRNAVHSLANTSAVILDFARVTTVDAHGLGVMLELRAHTEAKGIRLQLMNVSHPLRRILEITRLDSVFNITSGVEFFPAFPYQRKPSLVALKSCA